MVQDSLFSTGMQLIGPQPESQHRAWSQSALLQRPQARAHLPAMPRTQASALAPDVALGPPLLRSTLPSRPFPSHTDDSQLSSDPCHLPAIVIPSFVYSGHISCLPCARPLSLCPAHLIAFVTTPFLSGKPRYLSSGAPQGLGLASLMSVPPHILGLS